MLMAIAEKYIEVIKPSLSPSQKKKFIDGMGWTLACPFCRDAQKRQSKCNEKCASLFPREGTYTYFLSCNHTVRYSTFSSIGIHRST